MTMDVANLFCRSDQDGGDRRRGRIKCVVFIMIILAKNPQTIMLTR